MDQAVIYALIAVGIAAVAALYFIAQGWSDRRRAARREEPYRELERYARRADTAIIRLINEWETYPATASTVPEDIRNAFYQLHENFPKGF